jgi:hypothetical protein
VTGGQTEATDVSAGHWSGHDEGAAGSWSEELIEPAAVVLEPT